MSTKTEVYSFLLYYRDFIEAALEAEKNNAKIDSFYIQFESQFPKEIFK